MYVELTVIRYTFMYVSFITEPEFGCDQFIQAVNLLWQLQLELSTRQHMCGSLI